MDEPDDLLQQVQIKIVPMHYVVESDFGRITWFIAEYSSVLRSPAGNLPSRAFA